MADPLSITSGVVGILSLGIQVTQGLTTYYGLWKSHEDTLIHHDIRLDQLEKSLGILQTSISKLDHKDSLATQNVASTIVACENGMKKLKSSLDQCRLSPAQPGLHHRVRDTSRKALFPFKKATLDSLRSTVTELQSNVDNALQILGIDVLSNHGLAISTVVLASSRIDKGVHDTRSDLQGLGQSLDTWFENVNTNIKTTTEAAIVTILDQLGQQLIDLKTDQRSSSDERSRQIERLDNSIKRHQTDLIYRPSLLKAVCDESNLAAPVIELSRSTSNAKPFCRSVTRRIHYLLGRSRCTCKARINSVETRARWRSTIYSATTWHDKDCDYLGPSNRTEEVGLKFVFRSWWLARAVQVSITTTVGAGGWSINPSIKFSPVVAWDSPAFCLMEDIQHRKVRHTRAENEVENFFLSLTRKLDQLFREGKASPYDVDERGNNLLHKVFGAFRDNIGYITPAIYLRFVDSLLNMGMALNQVNAQDCTPLNIMVQNISYEVHSTPSILDFCLPLVGKGAELHEITEKNTRSLYQWPVDTQPLFRSLTQYAEAADCNNTIMAVIFQSKPQLTRAVAAAPNSINEVNRIGQTPLHLSGDWPTGLRLLLLAGADVNAVDIYGQIPIMCTVRTANVEALQILADAGSPIYTIESSDLLSRATRLERQPYETRGGLSMKQRAKYTDAVITLLAQRRRQLEAFARASLSKRDIKNLSLSKDRVIDGCVAQCFSALKSQEIAIPIEYLRDDEYSLGTTVYHLLWITPRIMETLWQAGFRDVDYLDYRGLTPLMTNSFLTPNEYLESIQWLISKGADVYRVDEVPGVEFPGIDYSFFRPDSRIYHAATIIHVAFQIGQKLPWDIGIDHKEESKLRKWHEGLSIPPKVTLIEILNDKFRDTCLCACSPGGCRSITAILKSAIPRHNEYYSLYPEPFSRSKNDRLLSAESFKSMIEWFFVSQLKLFEDDGAPSDTLFSEYIRWKTFDKLELRHTCCRKEQYGYRVCVPSLEEIEEIREEDRDLLEKLEELLDEFETKRQELGVSALEFLQGYWRTRMDEVLKDSSSLDEDALRRIGVVVHDAELENMDDDSDDEEFDDDSDEDDTENDSERQNPPSTSI